MTIEERKNAILAKITEIKASDGKVYLSPMIDCHDVFLVKLVFRFSSGIFFGFGRGCAGRVCFIGFGVCRT